MKRPRAHWLVVTAVTVIGGCTALAGLGGYEKADCVGAGCEAASDGAPPGDGVADGSDGARDSTLDAGDVGPDSTVDTATDSRADSTLDTATDAGIDGDAAEVDSTATDGPIGDSTVPDTALPDTALGDTGTPLDEDGFVGCDAPSIQDSSDPRCPPDMIAFPGGTYPSPHAPTGTNVVSPFCLDRFEVTGAQFKAVWEACGGDAAPLIEDCGAATYGDPRRPINCVDGMEAEALYCNRIGKRLPEDAEWEFAERNAPPDGAAGNQFPWGADALAPMDDAHLCWAATADGSPCTIHSFPAGDGLYPGAVVDLAGSVEEWTRTFVPGSGSSYYVRGGSFNTSDPDYPSADLGRGEYVNTSRSSDRGFRCARTRPF